MTLRESEGCIVPLKLEDQSSGSKPGNAGAGKASEPTRGPSGDPPNSASDDGSLSPDSQHALSCWCWWGAGCVNGARPVLGGAEGQLAMDQIL